MLAPRSTRAGLRVGVAAILMACRESLAGVVARLDWGTSVKIVARTSGGQWRTMLLVGTSEGRMLRGGEAGDWEIDARDVDAWLEKNLRPILSLTGVPLEVDESSP